MAVLVTLCGRFSLWPFSFVAVSDVTRGAEGCTTHRRIKCRGGKRSVRNESLQWRRETSAKYSEYMLVAVLRNKDKLLKPRPHQQQCRSNIVECYQSNHSFDKVERCFDIVAGVDGAL